MPGLRDQFAQFYVPDEDAIETALKAGLVVPDTNVILNLYRFQATARDELFGALEKVGNRLWAPHQVGLEFHQIRLSVMKEQEDYFDTTLNDLHAIGRCLPAESFCRAGDCHRATTPTIAPSKHIRIHGSTHEGEIEEARDYPDE